MMRKQLLPSYSVFVAFLSVFSCTLLCGCKESAAPIDVADTDRSNDKTFEPLGAPAKVDSILDRVLIIENANSPASIEIARYYREKRGVTNSFSIRCADSSLSAEFETLDFSAYDELIAKPLREYLASKPKIDFIVLTKGIPIRLSNAPVGFAPGRPSLDSCLAALDYFDRSDCLRAIIVENDLKGTAYVNRFWNSKERFSHAKYGGYLVTRLDGYTVDSAKALIDNSIASDAARPTGVILLDSMALADPVDTSKVPLTPFPAGMKDMETIAEIGWGEWNVDLFAANQSLSANGLPVEFDRTENFIGNRQWLMGYASWGSNDAKYISENYKSLRFAPGAIAETAVSTGARTFLPTSGGQSLIADLIESKVTCVKGYCDEPFLLAVASPSVLFDRYTRGWTMAESFYAASRFVGWEDIVIGDPLTAPYASR
jgi:uncharacterized protein (TIGR03790 family)